MALQYACQGGSVAKPTGGAYKAVVFGVMEAAGRRVVSLVGATQTRCAKCLASIGLDLPSMTHVALAFFRQAGDLAVAPGRTFLAGARTCCSLDSGKQPNCTVRARRLVGLVLVLTRAARCTLFEQAHHELAG